MKLVNVFQILVKTWQIVCDQFMFVKVNVTELGVESTIEQLWHMDPPFHVNLLSWEGATVQSCYVARVGTGSYWGLHKTATTFL